MATQADLNITNGKVDTLNERTTHLATKHDVQSMLSKAQSKIIWAIAIVVVLAIVKSALTAYHVISF